MKQEFRLYNTECIKITLLEKRQTLYFSSFNKAGKHLGISHTTLISSFKNDNGWRIWDKQPIKITIIDTDETIKELVDKELNC
jgi:hypothetical protein